MRAYNVTRNRTLIQQGGVAENAWTRLKGLIGHGALEAGEGLMVTPCNSIHTFFMRFPIDVLFVAEDGEIVGLAESLRPYRIGPIVRTAHFVLEMPAGVIAETETRAGDQVVVER